MNASRPQDPASNTKLTIPQIVEWAFGKRMTPQERLRKHQRALEKTQRELDRERVYFQSWLPANHKLISEIGRSN